MSDLETTAELTRLAALLRTDVSDLEFLAGQDVATLRELRVMVTDRLFDADRGVLESIARATRMVPGSVSAKVAVAAFPPALAARVAGVLDTDRAVDLARRVPVTYLADLAPHLDPRRVLPILHQLPSELLVAAGEVLGRRGQHITMANFVGVLDDGQVARTLAVLSDEALVRTGLVIEDPQRVADVLELLPPERLRGVVETAHARHLWDGVLRARPFVSEGTLHRITETADRLGAGVPDELRGSRT